MDNSVLKRRLEHPSADATLNVYQTVVPSSRVQDLVLSYHMGPSSGSHFGVSKCYNLLKERFYWPDMHTTVCDTISKCLRCAQVKGPFRRTKAPMKIFREGMLFGRYHLDFLGPLQPSVPDKYRYVAVVVEAFSSWPEAIPLRTKEAKEVAKALVHHVFSRFGAPYDLVTDQERTFESQLFKEVMNLYKVRKSRISAGKPSSNGKVENYIKSLTRQVTVLAAEEPKDWPDFLPHVLHAYRAAISSVTGFSPYEIMFGRKMRVPLDMAHGVPPGMELQDPQSYPAVLRERLDKIHKIVRENVQLAASRMKIRYDKLSTLVYFKPGDIVMRYNRRRRVGKSTKLYATWDGPFIILDLLNDCIARIEEVLPIDSATRKKRKRFIVHVDKLAAIGSHMVDQNGQWLTFHSD